MDFYEQFKNVYFEDGQAEETEIERLRRERREQSLEDIDFEERKEDMNIF